MPTTPVKPIMRRKRVQEILGLPVEIDGVEVSDYLASQNLNECVDALITKYTRDVQVERVPKRVLKKLILQQRKDLLVNGHKPPKVMFFDSQSSDDSEDRIVKTPVKVVPRNLNRLRKNCD